MSSGASVPTSTRAWLSSTSLSASCSARWATSTALRAEHQIPVGVADVGQRLRDRRAQRLFGDLAVDLRDGQLLPRLIDERARAAAAACSSPSDRVVNVGLKLTNVLDESCLLLFNVSAKLPPYHGTFCATPTL